MRAPPLLAGFLLTMTALLLFPASAAAGQEVTFVLGTLIGDKLTDVTAAGRDRLSEDFENAPVYGARVGLLSFPFGLEGSLVVSPSNIDIGNAGSIDARLIYAEADIQILLFPGPISPFLSGGIGLHNIKLNVGSDPSETIVGYIIGGGIKAGLGTIGVRVDLRDHITPLDVQDLDVDFRDTLGLTDDTTLHNVELSFGLSVRF
ncbi:MAG: hypothetical protein ACE5HV_17695 [Acidobacteriota bacterium]